MLVSPEGNVALRLSAVALIEWTTWLAELPVRELFKTLMMPGCEKFHITGSAKYNMTFVSGSTSVAPSLGNEETSAGFRVSFTFTKDA